MKVNGLLRDGHQPDRVFRFRLGEDAFYVGVALNEQFLIPARIKPLAQGPHITVHCEAAFSRQQIYRSPQRKAIQLYGGFSGLRLSPQLTWTRWANVFFIIISLMTRGYFPILRSSATTANYGT